MKTLIRNCRIVSPGLDIPSGNILLEDGRIAEVGGTSVFQADQEIDGTGKIAVPGFIDIHSHGRSNYDFCDGTAEAFAAIGRGKLQDGVTGFLATSLSVSEDDLRELCRQAENYKKNVPDGASLLGIHLEGPFFNPPCAGAQNPAFLQNPRIGLVDELNAISPVKKVSFSPELPGGIEFTRALAERSIMPSGGHTQADYECFEQCREAGMKHLTHFCNVMTPLHHLRFGMVGGGLMADDVYVEMICDKLHLCPDMIKLVFSNKDLNHILLITDAMRASSMPDGNYSLGGLPVVVKDGCARLTTGNVAGSTLRYFNGLKHLVRLTGLPLSEAVRCTSLNQAESLHLGKRGKIDKNYIADLVLLDSDLNVQLTMVNGIVRWKK